MEKIHPTQHGQCHVVYQHEGLPASFQIGIIETGRQRVFAGYYVRVTEPDGEEWLGEDALSMRSALRTLDEDIGRDGGRLLCAGLIESFQESGLSFNTGYGYLAGCSRAVHMMERPRLFAMNEFAAMSASPVAADVLAGMRERMWDEP